METHMDNLKYEIEEEARSGARIKVIGIGGGGCNAVSRLVREGLGGVEFHAMDTDLQALTACEVPHKLQLGARITKGLGAGSNAETGRQAALENTDDIVELLQGADMVFVSAGLGGGTGTGATGVVASLAKELEALTIAVVTKPFVFEGPRRMRMAEEGRRGLASCVDAVITIPNERLLALSPRGASFFDAFKLADDMLRQAVVGISDIINTTGIINRDFSDIKAVMVGAGRERGRGSRPAGHQLPVAGGYPHHRRRQNPHQPDGIEPSELPRSQRSLRPCPRGRRIGRRPAQFRRDSGRIHGRFREGHGDRHRRSVRERVEYGAPLGGANGDGASTGTRARDCGAGAGTRAAVSGRHGTAHRSGGPGHARLSSAGAAAELGIA
jgi:hypothetical protein